MKVYERHKAEAKEPRDETQSMTCKDCEHYVPQFYLSEHTDSCIEFGCCCYLLDISRGNVVTPDALTHIAQPYDAPCKYFE